MDKRGFWITLFLMPTIVIFLLIFAIPVITVIYTSFFEWRGFSGTMSFVGLTNYVEVFKSDKAFTRAFINTVLWITLQSTVHVALGTTLALILSKKPFGWKFVRTSYMLPNIISASALAVIMLNTFNPQFGIVNSVIRAMGFKDFRQNWFFDYATALPTVTFTWLAYAGLITILVLAEILSIDESIFEAAKIDGASELQIDLYVTIPMIRNIIGSCVLISATSMLKEFELISLTTKGGPADLTLNLPLYIYKTALIENNYGYANTVGTILILMGVICVVAIGRVFKMGQSDT